MRQHLVALAGLAIIFGGLRTTPAPVWDQVASGGTSTQCQSLYSQYIDALTSRQYPAAEAIFARFVRLACSLP